LHVVCCTTKVHVNWEVAWNILFKVGNLLLQSSNQVSVSISLFGEALLILGQKLFTWINGSVGQGVRIVVVEAKFSADLRSPVNRSTALLLAVVESFLGGAHWEVFFIFFSVNKGHEGCHAKR
jgi:hypothetical protein